MSRDVEIAFVEQRTYVLNPGCTQEYLRLYQAEGLAVQLSTLERLVGYYSVDVGMLNTVIHLWAFASQEDREARRARMTGVPVWASYWAKVRPLIQSQHSVFLKPAPFFAPRLSTMLQAAERPAAGASTSGTPSKP